MPTWSEQFRENLYNQFFTSDILTTIQHIDQLRVVLADDEDFRPPQIRDDLLRLHQLAMEFVNYGDPQTGREVRDKAFDLQDNIFTMIESLEAIDKTLSELTDLVPEDDDGL